LRAIVQLVERLDLFLVSRENGMVFP
jgi:hypothetical protein